MTTSGWYKISFPDGDAYRYDNQPIRFDLTFFYKQK